MQRPKVNSFNFCSEHYLVGSTIYRVKKAQSRAGLVGKGNEVLVGGPEVSNTY